ncbi:MAG: rhodanese-related sulfurtransferase [Kiritimatiellia bacterium]|jgi:rhodanese-related sulfurtransferase
MLIFAQEQFVLVISLGVLIFLFVRHESAKGGEKLSCPQVVKALNSDNAIVVDVRDAKEFEAGHIVDSINISHAKIADSLKVLEKYRLKQIIVVDKLGQHTAAVVKTLTANDFNVVRLGGGIAEWKQDNLPLVKT